MFRTWRTATMLIIVLIAAALASGDAHATRFGRNKVQYGAFDWNVVHTEHFDVYFYEGSEDLADAVSSIIESGQRRVRGASSATS